jgi:hypothetical protein
LRGFGLIAVAAIATGLLVGVVIANSGGSNSATPSIPELKPPPGAIESSSGATGSTGSTGATGSSTPTDTQTQTQTTQTQPSGGSQSPQQDNQTNDVAPPKGSPASRFEQFCKDNPGAC